MKFGRVIVELVKMNRRRFIIRLYRYIPLAGEFRAHVSLDLVQRFFRWRFIESHRDAVLVDVQPHLLHVRMRFNQPDHARPRAGRSIRALRVWNDFVCHLRIIIKRTTLVSAAIAIHCAFLANPPGEPGPSPPLARGRILVGRYPGQLALTLRA